MKLLYATLLVLGLSSQCALAQISMSNEYERYFYPHTNDVGREFYFAFPPVIELNDTVTYEYGIYVFSVTAQDVFVHIPASNYEQTVELQAGAETRIVLPENRTRFYLHKDDKSLHNDSLYHNKAIRLTSEIGIRAVAWFRVGHVYSQFALTPGEAVDKQYLISTLPESLFGNGNNQKRLPAFVSITGVFDATEVQVLVGGDENTTTASGAKQGDTLTYLLDRGDVVVVQSGAFGSQLSGTRILGTKPVSVVSSCYTQDNASESDIDIATMQVDAYLLEDNFFIDAPYKKYVDSISFIAHGNIAEAELCVDTVDLTNFDLKNGDFATHIIKTHSDIRNSYALTGHNTSMAAVEYSTHNGRRQVEIRNAKNNQARYNTTLLYTGPSVDYDTTVLVRAILINSFGVAQTDNMYVIGLDDNVSDEVIRLEPVRNVGVLKNSAYVVFDFELHTERHYVFFGGTNWNVRVIDAPTMSPMRSIHYQSTQWAILRKTSRGKREVHIKEGNIERSIGDEDEGYAKIYYDTEKIEACTIGDLSPKTFPGKFVYDVFPTEDPKAVSWDEIWVDRKNNSSFTTLDMSDCAIQMSNDNIIDTLQYGEDATYTMLFRNTSSGTPICIDSIKLIVESEIITIVDREQYRDVLLQAGDTLKIELSVNAPQTLYTNATVQIFHNGCNQQMSYGKLHITTLDIPEGCSLTAPEEVTITSGSSEWEYAFVYISNLGSSLAYVDSIELQSFGNAISIVHPTRLKRTRLFPGDSLRVTIEYDVRQAVQDSAILHVFGSCVESSMQVQVFARRGIIGSTNEEKEMAGRVYPHPVDGQSTLQLSTEPIGETHIRWYSAIGQQVLTTTYAHWPPAGVHTPPNLRPGLWFARIESTSGVEVVPFIVK